MKIMNSFHKNAFNVPTLPIEWIPTSKSVIGIISILKGKRDEGARWKENNVA